MTGATRSSEAPARRPRAALVARLALAARGAASVGLFIAHVAPLTLSGLCPLLLLLATVAHDGRVDASAWVTVFGDLDRWGVLLARTGVALGVALPVTLGVAVTLAVVLLRTDVACRTAAVALLILGALTPFHIVAASWIDLVGLEAVRGSAVALGLLHAAALVPVATLVIGVSVRAVPASWDDLLRLEGASLLRTGAFVALRGARVGIGVAAILVALSVTTDFTAANLILVRSWPQEVNDLFALTGGPAAPTLVALPQMVWLYPALFFLLGRWALPAARVPERTSDALALGRWRAPASVAVIAASGATAALLVAYARAKASLTRGVADYVAVFGEELVTSTWTSAVAALSCALVAPGLARLLGARRSGPWLTAWLAATLATPAPLLAIAVARLLASTDVTARVQDSPWVFVVVYVVRFLPIATLVTLILARSASRAHEEHARVEGAGVVGIWRHVVLPASLPAMGTVWLVVFALAVAELPASSVVMPPGFPTIGPRFFSLVHYGMVGDAVALALFSMGGVLAAWALATLPWRTIGSWRGRRVRRSGAGGEPPAAGGASRRSPS